MRSYHNSRGCGNDWRSEVGIPDVDLNAPYSGETWVGFCPPKSVRDQMRKARVEDARAVLRAVACLN